MRILISAGEASGEMYGAQLIEALRAEFSELASTGVSPVREHVGTGALAEPALSDRAERGSRMGPVERSSATGDTTHLDFFGVGGEKMRSAGCDIVIDARDLAVVGITEILSHLPKIWRLFHKLINEADRRRPDLAVVIDSPAFNWRVAREMKNRGIPVVYYVCPQFWAWRQGRVKLLRKYVDKALVIFPFEEKFYRERGVNAEFVGHPLAEVPRPKVNRESYAQTYGLDIAKQWIALMPGSRVKEVRMNLPEMLRATQLLGGGYEFLIPAAPTLDRDFLKSLLRQEHPRKGRAFRRAVKDSVRANGTAENPALSASGPPTIHLVPEALPALAHSRAGVIASGTATVEAAIMETPFAMVYRVTPLTYLLGRWTVKVPHFAMVNLIAGEKVVPELVQKDFTAEAVVHELCKLIPDGAARDKMLGGLKKVRSLLGGSAAEEASPATRTARAISALLSGSTLPRQPGV